MAENAVRIGNDSEETAEKERERADLIEQALLMNLILSLPANLERQLGTDPLA